jgi:hypothetical protein
MDILIKERTINLSKTLAMSASSGNLCVTSAASEAGEEDDNRGVGDNRRLY